MVSYKTPNKVSMSHTLLGRKQLRNLLTQRMVGSAACGTCRASPEPVGPTPSPLITENKWEEGKGWGAEGQGVSSLRAHTPPPSSLWTLSSSLLLFFIQSAQGPPFSNCVKFSCIVLDHWIPWGKAKTPEFPHS